MGAEMYKLMNKAADTDAELRRKLLLWRWMYIQVECMVPYFSVFSCSLLCVLSACD